MLASPMQLAVATSVMASKGQRRVPRLVHSVDGVPVDASPGADRRPDDVLAGQCMQACGGGARPAQARQPRRWRSDISTRWLARPAPPGDRDRPGARYTNEADVAGATATTACSSPLPRRQEPTIAVAIIVENGGAAPPTHRPQGYRYLAVGRTADGRLPAPDAHQGSADLARRPSCRGAPSHRYSLLLLLLVLTVYGLIVLYSGSGSDMDAVIRRALFRPGLSGHVHRRPDGLGPHHALGAVVYLMGLATAGGGDAGRGRGEGAQRWLAPRGFRFQPSEILKLVLPLTVAWYLADRALPPRFVHIMVALGILGLPAVLILSSPTGHRRC